MTRNTINYGEGKFYAIEPRDLKTVSVVAQALDNQWIRQQLFSEMLRKKKSLKDVTKRREKAVRSEYFRALLNSEQVVINRAYLYNNPVVFKDFQAGSQHVQDFKTLLNTGVLVPFLFRETSPAESPAFTVGPGYEAWRRVALETAPSCVRFSWEDKINNELTSRWLSQRFSEFVTNLAWMDGLTLAQDLRLSRDAEGKLKEILVEAGHWGLDFAAKDKFITREDFYKKFVCVDGTTPADGIYDPEKPFSRELKTLIDLKYTLNLPDGLGILGLTPLDSPPRTVLQEWREEQQKKTEITADDLLKLLRNTAFDLVQQSLGIPSLHELNLDHVLKARDSAEWHDYINATKKILNEPLKFPLLAPLVYDKYIRLADTMRKIRTDIAESKLQRWQPTVTIVFEVAGAYLTTTITPTGIQPELWGKISSKIIGGVAPVVARLVIGGVARVKTKVSDFGFNIVFLRGRMKDAFRQWDDFTQRVSELPGYRKAVQKMADVAQSPSMDQPVEDQYT